MQHNSAMMKICNLVVVTLASSLCVAEGSLDGIFRRLQGSRDLPVCEGDVEVQFFNIEIEFSNLPDECNNEFDLEIIGFLIQDVVSEVEERMPEYEGEYLDTILCPLPESNTARHLEKVSRRLAGTYTYIGTGRCRRCRTRYTTRRLRQNRFLTWFGFGQRSLQSNCTEETETVTIQKDLAEAAVRSADTTLFDLTELAKDFQDNEEVKSIISIAESSNRKVKAESTLASTAAELTMAWCSQTATPRLQSRIEDFHSNAQKAMTDTVNAARRARDELDQVKEAKRDMEELISILAAEPEVNELETALKEEKAELAQQIETIDAEIAEVDSALKALEDNVTVIYADSTTIERIIAVQAELERVKNILEVVKNAKETEAVVVDATSVYYVPPDKILETTSRFVQEEELLTMMSTLLAEKLRLEQAVKSNEELIQRSSDSQEALYSEPRNFTTDPVLQYALEQIDGTVYGSTSNWDSDPYAEPTSTREEWFAKFARLLILEIPIRLKNVYNTTSGGCINGSLDMLVIITELESMSDRIASCTDEALFLSTSSPMEAAVLLPVSSSPTASPKSGRTSSPTTSTGVVASTSSPSFLPTTPSASAELDPITPPIPSWTSSPSTGPTVAPTSSPSESPTMTSPRANPSKAPTVSPTMRPTPRPTRATLTSSPMVTPTGQLKPEPTAGKTTATPTSSPKTNPTTTSPRAIPSKAPTASATITRPTASPTLVSRSRPTSNPASTPTAALVSMSRPTASPTLAPTAASVVSVSRQTARPSLAPTLVAVDSVSAAAEEEEAAVADLTAGSNSTSTESSTARPTFEADNDSSKDSSKDSKDSKDNKASKDSKDSKDRKDSKDSKDSSKDTKVTKDSKDTKVRRILKWRK